MFGYLFRRDNLKITNELKTRVKAEITLCLDVYGQSDEVDKQLVELVCSLIAELQEPKAAPVEHIAVKYVGDLPEIRDLMFETGFWKLNEVKMVPRVVASKMFAHPHYVPAGKKDKPKEIIDGAIIEEAQKMEDDYHVVLNAIDIMTDREQVIKFVSDNFNGLKLEAPKDIPMEELKHKAMALVDQYGLPQ